MRTQDDGLVRVRSSWNGWRTADVRANDLRDVHWYQPSRAPTSILHGYIACSTIVAGDIPHECDGRSAPHRLLVCILKRHTMAAVYADLAQRAARNGGGASHAAR